MSMKRTTVFLADEDIAAIETIKKHYGVSTASDAIRLTLRILANVQDFQVQVISKQESGIIVVPNA